MKPIGLATFIAGMFVLGISLLWFPDLLAIFTTLMPVGTPTWLTGFLTVIPYATLSIILIAYVIKLGKRGQSDTQYKDEK